MYIIHISICINIFIYIYIYLQREREERLKIYLEKSNNSKSLKGKTFTYFVGRVKVHPILVSGTVIPDIACDLSSEIPVLHFLCGKEKF